MTRTISAEHGTSTTAASIRPPTLHSNDTAADASIIREATAEQFGRQLRQCEHRHEQHNAHQAYGQDDAHGCHDGHDSGDRAYGKPNDKSEIAVKGHSHYAAVEEREKVPAQL